MPLKRLIVRFLNRACTWVDDVAYRPAVVKATLWLPRWWGCELARLSMRLDDRWATGYWSGDDAPAAPAGRCESCQRRAAWLVMGGTFPHYDEEPLNYYLADRPLYLCSWCHVDEPAGAIEDEAQLRRALASAREQSIAWRWRWSPNLPARADAVR
jgi:hypothetical protein